MAQVTVTIAGRVYRMACGEGEEAHLESLARAIDAKIEDLRGSFGEIGDQRITVMAALTFADELSEVRRKVAELEFDLAQQREALAGASAQSAEWGRSAAEALTRAASRIESLAQGMRG